jgi:hypothetical protein
MRPRTKPLEKETIIALWCGLGRPLYYRVVQVQAQRSSKTVKGVVFAQVSLGHSAHEAENRALPNFDS